MDLDLIAAVVERAVISLGLTAPVHPWWLGQKKPRRPVRLSRLLASPCPDPVDYPVEPQLLLRAFLPEDRDTIAIQIEDGFQHLIVLSDDPAEPVDEASVVHVQLGVPLIGRDRVLLRVRTRNLYADAQTVTGEFHAWLDPAGTLPEILSRSQEELASVWKRWCVGRSPGLAYAEGAGGSGRR